MLDIGTIKILILIAEIIATIITLHILINTILGIDKIENNKKKGEK